MFKDSVRGLGLPKNPLDSMDLRGVFLNHCAQSRHDAPHSSQVLICSFVRKQKEYFYLRSAALI